MDPTVTLAILNDSSELGSNRIEAARSLGEWLIRGGFVPDIVGNGYQVSARLWSQTGQFLLDANLPDLYSALNVALEYDDISGLVGLGFGN